MPRKMRDPRANKARDNAKRTTRRHKIAESAARKIKAHTNQSIRRAGKIAVREAREVDESAGITPHLKRRARLGVWPAENASERRKARKAERDYLDATAGDGPKGRRRATLFRNAT